MTAKPFDRTRHKTDYPGVFWIAGTRKGKEGPEKIYYIIYKRQGKLHEEKSGRQYQDAMTPAKAARIRARKIDGTEPTNKEIREKKLIEDERKRLEEAAIANRWTMDRLFHEYLASKSNTLKGITTDRNRYQKHLQSPFGLKTSDEIIPLDLDRLKRNLLKTHSSGTVRNIMELLRRLINWGVDQDLFNRPALKFNLPDQSPARIEVLTDKQFQNLVQVWASYHDRHVVNMHRLIAWTGMRPSEVCRLEWTDLDQENGVLIKRDTKGGGNVGLRMNNTVNSILSEHRELIESSSEPMRTSKFIFPRLDGKQRHPDGWRKRVRQILKLAGIPDNIRPNYVLRDTIATSMLSDGAGLEEVGYQLGHKVGSTATRRYADFDRGAKQRIVERSQNVLEKKLNGSKVIDLESRRGKGP